MPRLAALALILLDTNMHLLSEQAFTRVQCSGWEKQHCFRGCRAEVFRGTVAPLFPVLGISFRALPPCQRSPKSKNQSSPHRSVRDRVIGYLCLSMHREIYRSQEDTFMDLFSLRSIKRLIVSLIALVAVPPHIRTNISRWSRQRE
jgi:hypothetical protein